MSRKSLREHLQNYYENHSLPTQDVERLTRMARASKPGKEHSMAQLLMAWWPRTLAGFAAGAIIVLIGVAFFLPQSEEGRQAFTSSSTAVPGVELRPVMNAGMGSAPSLVAVQIQADWCRRTPIVAPLFKELTSKYGNQPILFVTLDITDETKRKQARLLASNLGIDRVFDEPFESGMIKLLDRDQKKVLMILTEEEHRPRMEVLLAQAVDLR